MIVDNWVQPQGVSGQRGSTYGGSANGTAQDESGCALSVSTGGDVPSIYVQVLDRSGNQLSSVSV
ncbi:MAG: hypothetical protein M3Y57_16025 [Acidobacteriota bacterium]|nr:hypothetical protein [Acidobacteriota bacterium]